LIYEGTFSELCHQQRVLAYPHGYVMGVTEIAALAAIPTAIRGFTQQLPMTGHELQPHDRLLRVSQSAFRNNNLWFRKWFSVL